MSKSNYIANPDASVLHSDGSDFIFYAKTTSSPMPTNPIERRQDENYSKSEVAYWGQNNDFPDTLNKEIEGSSIIPSTLDFKARMLNGIGIEYGYREIIDREEVFTPIIDSEIQKFLWKSNVNRYTLKAADDLYKFNNVFPEFVLSVDKKKVISILAQEANFCRWEKQDRKGFIKNCFIKTNWKDKPSDISGAITVPVIDIYTHNTEEIRQGKSHKYIFPLSIPTGKIYYQTAPWYSIIKSGWLDVAKAIPAFKKALMKNQITAKYLIKVPEYYWKWRYPKNKDSKGWDSFSNDDKIKLKKEALEQFENFLSGNENAGKSIMVDFKFDEATKKEYPSWEIVPIDNKLKDGTYIEDSQEASSHILYALQTPAQLLGNAPGKSGQGSGSGSDVRELANFYLILNHPYEKLILEPLQFISEYNGWNAKYGQVLEFRFKKAFLQTKDEVAPKKRETIAE
ncbi:hypothetical protein V9L05_15295 [Bernardetia sp. Wsw4-3y2]|uniref:hypothetical protein n=1 Tax=Bernardetia sp. Wsw4-3y2 TaxID=3127471 RepID=UPI0030CCA702